MEAYVYSVETREVEAIIVGDDNESIEKKFASMNWDSEAYGLTYSPAFGTVDGLIEISGVETVHA